MSIHPQERWEAEQLKRSRQLGKVGAGGAAEGQQQYEYVFEDQIDFIKVGVANRINFWQGRGSKSMSMHLSARWV